MADMFDVQSKRGSLWHRWDPHIHTPGTALNDQYAGPDPWAAFLDAIEASNPPIRAIGITDYFGIERYEQVTGSNGRIWEVSIQPDAESEERCLRLTA